MENSQNSEREREMTPDEKALAARLMELAPHFPERARAMWAIKERKSVRTVTRYMTGDVRNVTLAKALIADIETYMKKGEKVLMVA